MSFIRAAIVSLILAILPLSNAAAQDACAPSADWIELLIFGNNPDSVIAEGPEAVAARIAQGQQQWAANTLDDLTSQIDLLTEEHGANHVLVVFDVDNTLLRSTEDFGSNAWIIWQYILNRRGCSELVADPLLPTIHLALATGDQSPAEDGTPAYVANLMEQGHPVVALTSRSPLYRGPTLRELDEAGIVLTTALTCAAPSDDPADPCVLSETERNASYERGVMMTNSMNKGDMLLNLLASTTEDIRAVVFVDDGLSNVVNVLDAFAPTDDGLGPNCRTSDVEGRPEICGFRYAYMDAASRAFWESDGRSANAAQQLRDLEAALADLAASSEAASESAE